MRLSKQLVSLLLSLGLSSACVSYRVSDWNASITLPASEDCYSFAVMSGTERRIPKDDPECIRMKLRSIWLDYESYKMLRTDIRNNCLAAKCTQIRGALDNLFLIIDESLKKIP